MLYHVQNWIFVCCSLKILRGIYFYGVIVHTSHVKLNTKMDMLTFLSRFFNTDCHAFDSFNLFSFLKYFLIIIHSYRIWMIISICFLLVIATGSSLSWFVIFPPTRTTLSVSPSPPKSVPNQTRNSRPILSLLARITFKSHGKVHDNNFREVRLILF